MDSTNDISRRELLKRCGQAAAWLTVGAPAAGVLEAQVTLGGEFDFHLTNGGLQLEAHDVTINGLSIPKFTWGWVGMAIAEGVLAQFGGMVFGAVANAIFGGTHTDIGELLSKQLKEFSKFVGQALQEAALAERQGELVAYVTLLKEYGQNPGDKDRLDFLKTASAVTLGKIKALGFGGYATYIPAAGMRLSILQEIIKRAPDNQRAGEVKNLLAQRDEAVQHHEAMSKMIDDVMSPAEVERRTWGKIAPFLKMPGLSVAADIDDDFLGYHVTGHIPVLGGGKYKHDDPHAPNWPAARAARRAQTTDIGQLVVDRWKKLTG